MKKNIGYSLKEKRGPGEAVPGLEADFSDELGLATLRFLSEAHEIHK